MASKPTMARRNLPVAVAVVTAGVLLVPSRVLFPDCGPNAGPLAAKPVVLRVLTASQKATFVERIVTDEFLATRPQVGGRCIKVEVGQKSSGLAADAFIRGWNHDDGVSSRPVAASTAESWYPDVWYPSASVWWDQVRERRPEIVPATLPPSVAETPHVVAMPRRMAEALGWPRAPIGWKDLFDLARTPGGWETRGHPEWGSFRFGKTNPNHSTSGLFATVGAYFAAKQAAAGPAALATTDLSLDDVFRPDILEFVKAVESSVVDYGDISLKLLPSLRRADDEERGLEFVSAVALQETSVLEYNLGNQTGEVGAPRLRAPPREPLVAVYPSEGVLFADQPYVVLRAPWVSEDRRRAAGVLLDFLRSPKVQERFLDAGFRVAGRVGAAVSVRNGLLPGGPAIRLDPPPSAVVDAVRGSWAGVRKRARVLIVLDASKAMGRPARDAGPSRLELVQQAATKALTHFGDDDEIGLWTYSPKPVVDPPYLEFAPLAPLSGRRPFLDAAIASLRPAGGIRLAATLARALERLKRDFDPTRINGIVVISQGPGPPGAGDAERLNSVVKGIGDEATAGRVRVFPIAYGPGADCETAERIANASRTEAECVEDPTRIWDAVDDAVSNF